MTSTGCLTASPQAYIDAKVMTLSGGSAEAMHRVKQVPLLAGLRRVDGQMDDHRILPVTVTSPRTSASS